MPVTDVQQSQMAGAGPGDRNMEAGRVLVALGLILLLVGGIDILLAWIPLQLGNADWEFGTISMTLNVMPVPSMGLAILTAVGLVGQNRPILSLVASWSVLVSLSLLGAAVLYLLDVPLAMRAMEDPANRAALRTAVLKAAFSLLVYLVFHVFVAARSIRALRQG